MFARNTNFQFVFPSVKSSSVTKHRMNNSNEKLHWKHISTTIIFSLFVGINSTFTGFTVAMWNNTQKETIYKTCVATLRSHDTNIGVQRIATHSKVCMRFKMLENVEFRLVKPRLLWKINGLECYSNSAEKHSTNSQCKTQKYINEFECFSIFNPLYISTIDVMNFG